MEYRSFKKHLIAGIAVWTGIIAVLFVYEAYEHWESFKGYSLTEAKSALDKDLVYRLWNTHHGGVYVPVTDKTPPNPYLSFIPDRDITLPSGKRLTLMNPSYMTRQVHEIESKGRGLLGHMTSLNPVNPQNTPDAWEKGALEAFEQGSAEASTIATIGGRQYLRYMQPLRAEKGCLTCHGHQGYREGEIRGGLAVAVPLDPMKTIFRKELILEIITYLFTWLTGLGFIVLGYRKVVAKTAELQENEQKFKSIFDNATDGILLADTESRKFFMANTMIRDMLGYSAEEMKLIGVEDIHPRESLPNVLQQFEKQTLGKLLVARDIPVLRKDGTIFYADINSSPVRLMGKTYLLGFFRDITERKQAEEALLESEQRYELFLNNFQGIAYQVVSRSFSPVFFHGTVEEITGYQPFDFLKGTVSWDRLVHPDDLPVLLGEREKFAALSGHIARSEYRIIRKDGQVRWVADIFRAPGELVGETALLQGAVYDITERKMAEETLRMREQQYRLLFENNPHPMWVYDLETLAFLAVNAAAIEHYGYSLDEFQRMTIRDIRPAEDIPALLDNVSQVTTGRDEAGIWRHRKKDGSVIQVEITSDTIDFNGRRAELVLAHDVTQRLKAEHDRSVLEEQLRQAQKMEAIGLLAGGVAHDFNNILSAIMGYASMLQMKMGKDDLLLAHVQEILSSTERAANLTRSLLAFSRKQIINPRPVRVNDAVRNVEKLLRRLIGEDIEFRAIYSSAALTVMADPSQMEQVFMNLAANARDAMPRGGRLTVETRQVSIGEDLSREYGLDEKGEYAVISVSDTGSGMDEKTRERIFEPFFTTKEMGRGTGLGLSIVYGIIRQNQGNILCESAPGKGTTFRICLPLIRDEKAEESTAGAEELPKRGAETVLIAEDDDSVRRLAHSLFEEFGYRVITAADGEEAVLKFNENRDLIQLVVLDVIMPKKNGKEVYEEIIKVRPQIKVLFTSGYTADIVSSKGIGNEGVHFITKPYSPLELLRKSRDILDT